MICDGIAYRLHGIGCMVYIVGSCSMDHTVWSITELITDKQKVKYCLAVNALLNKTRLCHLHY